MDASRLTIKEQKKNLRNEINTCFETFSNEHCSDLSRLIEQRLLATELFLEAESLFIYVATDKEVATRSIIQESLSMRKIVYVPRILENKQLAIHRIENHEKDLVPGKYSIDEPHIQSVEITEFGSIPLFILPGVAFSRKGHRLGRGGGYFDRFFAKQIAGKKLALAYEFQIVDSVPVEEHDQIMDGVLTEKNFYWSGK